LTLTDFWLSNKKGSAVGPFDPAPPLAAPTPEIELAPPPWEGPVAGTLWRRVSGDLPPLWLDAWFPCTPGEAALVPMSVCACDEVAPGYATLRETMPRAEFSASRRSRSRSESVKGYAYAKNATAVVTFDGTCGCCGALGGGAVAALTGISGGRPGVGRGGAVTVGAR